MSVNLVDKLTKGLKRSKQFIGDRIEAAISKKEAIDEEVLDEIEEILISADIGTSLALEIIEKIRKDLYKGQGEDVVLIKKKIEEELFLTLLDVKEPPSVPTGKRAIMVVGVNGVGKTTTIAKLAWLSKSYGHGVLLAAADTFRAAAIEQLVVWGNRLGVDVIKNQPGSDPGAVVYNALKAASARGIDDLYIDTAGRLHNKEHLMRELGKIKRIVVREKDFHLITLLVLDATTGQNALNQAKIFSQFVNVDGIVLSKIDGTAKGGIVVSIAKELKIPVLYLGVGEKIEDIVAFDPSAFVRAIV